MNLWLAASIGIGAMVGLVNTVGLTVLAYAGYGMITNAAASVARPAVTIPRAIFLAITTVMVLYVGLAIVVVSSLTPAQLAQYAGIAVAEAARPVLGHTGFVIVAIGALLATASAINGNFYGIIQWRRRSPAPATCRGCSTHPCGATARTA